MPSHKGVPLRRSLRKCPKLSHDVEESDPFGRLTDDIIVSHILSRLPVHEAVRTSVLSRRWLTLWPASIGPQLIFPFSFDYSLRPDRRSRHDIDRFTPLLIRGVSNILEAYSKPTLDELTVCFDFDSRSSQYIDMWVQYAFTKGVTRLHLDFLHLIPCCTDDIYTFPGIQKLSALHILCNNDLHLPVNCTGMYNLRDICLKYINVSSEVVDFMLSHCPFLERLSVWGSKCVEVLRVSTQSSKFKSLEIVHCYYVGVKISSPYLVSLQYSGLREGLLLEYVPLLSELSIGSGYCRTFLRRSDLHFGYISQLKKLTLDLSSTVTRKSITYPLEFSELVKLEQLEVKLCASKDSCLLWPIILIKAAPNLRIFSVKLDTKYKKKDRAKLQHENCRRNLLNAVKQVHHQFLKLIEIKGFCGNPSEVELGQHLLGISESLEQVVVKPLLPMCRDRPHPQDDTLSSGKEYREHAQQFRNWLPPAVKLVVH